MFWICVVNSDYIALILMHSRHLTAMNHGRVVTIKIIGVTIRSDPRATWHVDETLTSYSDLLYALLGLC